MFSLHVVFFIAGIKDVNVEHVLRGSLQLFRTFFSGMEMAAFRVPTRVPMYVLKSVYVYDCIQYVCIER